jgi:hypothetical protein
VLGIPEVRLAVAAEDAATADDQRRVEEQVAVGLAEPDDRYGLDRNTSRQ